VCTIERNGFFLDRRKVQVLKNIVPSLILKNKSVPVDRDYLGTPVNFQIILF